MIKLEFLAEDNEAKLIIEGTGSDKKYFIEGVTLQTEIKNRNGRMYPKATMQKEVARYVREMIDRNRAVGEMGHPNSPTINGERVSHKFLWIKEDGNNYISRSRITTHLPMGQVAKGLIDEGIEFGLSSRGMGSLKESNGMNIVQEDFHMATAGDIVFDPSAPDAFVQGMMENKEWIWENGLFVEGDLSEARKKMEKAKQKQLEEVALQIFTNLVNKL